MKNIGPRVRSLRQQRNLSQGQLAVYSGLKRPHISLIENGERIPGAETLTKLARGLNTTTDYLVGLTDDPSPNLPVDRDSLSVEVRGLLEALVALPEEWQARFKSLVVETAQQFERIQRGMVATSGEVPVARLLAEVDEGYEIPAAEEKEKKLTLDEQIAELVQLYPDLGPLFDEAKRDLPRHAVYALVLNVQIWIKEKDQFTKLHHKLGRFLRKA